MKALIQNLIFILVIGFQCYGQKYYTLSDGEWNNTSSVWSLNGTTPCGCFPGNILNADTIIVNHAVKMTSNVTAKAWSKLNINAAGSLASSNFDIFVLNSVVYIDGSLSLRELSLGSSGSVFLTNSSLTVRNRILIAGILVSDGANISMIEGNLEVASTGSLLLSNNSWLHFVNGNLKNDGQVEICSDCCISFDAGNVFNELSGVFSGSGGIMSFSGNVRNYGVWDNAIAHCTSGSDLNLANADNCPLVDGICAFAPLPVDLLYFKGNNENGLNFLEWETSSESNSDFYAIERSFNGLEWKTIGTVSAQGNSTELSYYHFSDSEPFKGLTYYKLKQIDIDGAENFSRMLSLTNREENEINIYPNPSNEVVTIQINENCTYKTIRLLDTFGRLICIMEIGDTTKFDLQLPEEKGIYFIQAEGEDFTKTYTITKI